MDTWVRRRHAPGNLGAGRRVVGVRLVCACALLGVGTPCGCARADRRARVRPLVPGHPGRRRRPARRLVGPEGHVGKAMQHLNGHVSRLRAGVREQDLHQVRHHVRHAQLLGPAGLAREGVQRGVADELDGIGQSQGENRCRRLVGSVIEEAQATTAHEGVGMAKRRELNLANRSVGCDRRPSPCRRGHEPLQEALGPRMVVMPAVPTGAARRGRHVFNASRQPRAASRLTRLF